MRKFLLTLGLMLAISSLSFAGLIQTQTLSVALTDVPIVTTLTFMQYGGPLTVDSIEIIVESEVMGEFVFSNNKNGAGFDAPKTLLAGGVASGGVVGHFTLVEFLGFPIGAALGTASPLIAVDTVLADDEIFAPPPYFGSSGPVASDITALMGFLLGGGTFDVTVKGVGDFVLPGVSGGDLNISSDVNGGAKVTVNFYDSDALVPEPSTYAMMGAGVGLLALARYRRSRS